jgi:hypothetical protein
VILALRQRHHQPSGGRLWAVMTPLGSCTPRPRRRAKDSRSEEEIGCSSAIHSTGTNVPAVGKPSRAIQPLPMLSGITAPVSKRAKEHCNAPRNSRPALAWSRRTLTPRRRQEASSLRDSVSQEARTEQVRSESWPNSAPVGHHTCCSGKHDQSRGGDDAMSEVFGHPMDGGRGGHREIVSRKTHHCLQYFPAVFLKP